MPLHHVEDLNLLQCGCFHLIQLLDCHLLCCDLDNLHCQLLPGVSMHAPANHAAHTPEAPVSQHTPWSYYLLQYDYM